MEQRRTCIFTATSRSAASALLSAGTPASLADPAAMSSATSNTAIARIAVCFIMFLILVPYSAFTSLGDVLGERELFRLFFVDRAADRAVRDHLTGRMPPAQRHG